MAQAAKKQAVEMTPEEYSAEREKFIKTDGTKFDLVVTAIRSMSDAEFKVFAKEYGIYIEILPKD